MEYSIWLICAGEDYRRFSRIIQNISRQHGSMPFEPHVTIATAEAPEDVLLESAQKISAMQGLQKLMFEKICVEDVYFRAFYLLAKNIKRLTGANSFALNSLGKKSSAYMPHMSLAYGNFDSGIKQQIKNEICMKLPVKAEFDRIALWKTGVDMHQWKLVKEFILCS